jgi:hypothetical protein
LLDIRTNVNLIASPTTRQGVKLDSPKQRSTARRERTEIRVLAI